MPQHDHHAIVIGGSMAGLPATACDNATLRATCWLAIVLVPFLTQADRVTFVKEEL